MAEYWLDPTLTQILTQYANSGQNLLTPLDYMVNVLDYTVEEANQVLDSIEEANQ